MPTFSDLRELIAIALSRSEGQTMAEYGVTLAVITVALLAVFTALSGGVQGAINRVIGFLPS
jgi:Flp pilus assembly pilin Flp